MPPIDAKQPLRSESVTCLLKRFPDGGLDDCFVRLEMACRLVEQYAVASLFLDEQEFPLLFDNSRNSYIGFPNHGDFEYSYSRASIPKQSLAPFIGHCGGLTPSATAGTTTIPTSAISERQILLENEGEHATKEELGHAE